VRIPTKLSVLALVSLLVPGVARAADIGGGFKAGLNFATVSNADQTFFPAPVLTAGSVESARFIGGFFIWWRLGDVLSFEPEVLYSAQGVKGVTAGLSNVESTANINMVQIPLLLRIGRHNGPYAIVGPAMGFVQSATLQTAGKPDVDIKAALKNRDSSIVLGGGVAFGSVVAEARYTVGFVDMNKIAGPVANRNRVFSVLAGVRF